MTHFGVISPPVSGHLNPLIAVGLELQAQGHQVTFFQMKDVEEKVLNAGLNFQVIGLTDHPPGSLKDSLHTLGTLSGLKALKFAINAITQTTEMFCRDAPELIRTLKIEALLVDQTEPAGGSIAEYLGIPFITLCCALAINRDPFIPPIFTSWSYQTNGFSKLRNQLAYKFYDSVTAPVKLVIQRYRKDWNLPPLQSIEDTFSKLAQISQQPAQFAYPLQNPPPNFYYVGPFRSKLQTLSSFPYEKLNGKPLVYASLGTQQNTKVQLFTMIADACKDLDVQLVIAHAGGLQQNEVEDLSQKALVVHYAPQFELLKYAALTITHAGLNTVLDSIYHGVPIVAIPITYEQPAIAELVQWTGHGDFIHYQKANIEIIRQKILHNIDLFSPKKTKRAVHSSESSGAYEAASIIVKIFKKV